MDTSEGLSFVNRGAELAFLNNCLRRPEAAPALIIIRSPAGFGKSRLTDELSIRCDIPGLTFCIVDPSVRARTGAARLHDGFFLQRCAAELSTIAEKGNATWPTLETFLKTRRWRTVREKAQSDTISELPSYGLAYRIAFDYAARFFAFGRFSAKQLLNSDRSDAVRICSEFVEAVVTTNSISLVVREVQHSDLDSLRMLLRVNQLASGPDLILEYTCGPEEFEPEHQKLFMRTAELHNNFHILELVRLDSTHLEYLIRHNIKSNFDLTSDFYLTWNGNLRSIIELKYQVGIGQKITSPAQIGNVLGNLNKTLELHIGELPSLQRLILAIVLVHIEAIDRWTLIQAVASINPRTASNDLNAALRELIDQHRFLAQSGGIFRIQNETIALAASDSPAIRPFIALAEKALRDHYAGLVDRAEYGGVGISAAVRQLFRLCARTRDVAGLVHATEALSAEVKRSQDQSVYVDVVATAIEADPALYAQDHDDLIVWAASVAYDVCDWGRVANLLVLKINQDSFSWAMRAFALQEIGRHDEALSLAHEIRAQAACSDERLTAGLIEAIILGCRGQRAAARLKLNELVDDPENQNSPLIGYAYRFFEVTAEVNESFDKLRASIDWFERFGFHKSKAYSQLPAAVLMARKGNVGGGRSLMIEAERALAREIRDQHMILNDRAAIDLLDDSPNFASCKEMLLSALRYARDDYSELTILTNLGISYLGMNEIDSAIDCVDKGLAILKHHDFAEIDIYWPVCFNAGQIFSAAGLIGRRDEVLRFPREYGQPVTVNRRYWAYRYHEIADVDEEYKFLASRRSHPLYLSHWLVDLEGLNLLKQARQQ
jgi:tetratricopeptide (TPR) repeat protein